jgi:predicted SnoaL-like aldol condensation-catalyzing enzyme
MGSQPEPDMTEQERNRRFVVQHFDDFVNNKDLEAIDRNMSEDFLDHDGPDGQPTDRDGDRAMMAAMHDAFPDLHVEVLAAVGDGDMVVVRNVWTGTNVRTGQRMQFRGFVQWRIADGKIVERWATVTAPVEFTDDTVRW